METSLYAPVKRFLEDLGFSAKGEVCGCDVVAIREGEELRVVVAELKTSFNLELLLQGVERQAACDEVWLAVAASTKGRDQDRRVRKLCRLTGLGLLSVLPTGRVEILVSPEPWKPRPDRKRRSRLVAEHRRRRGDPTSGGSTRRPIMTAYRQQALACALVLSEAPARPRDLKSVTPDAPKILQSNVYGWFERIERGIYGLSEGGKAALVRWADALPAPVP
ncbi:MAG: DUF2161 family putative PD-(D/E)XK-type phosphodiesterase [Rhodoblastus sp.]